MSSIGAGGLGQRPISIYTPLESEREISVCPVPVLCEIETILQRAELRAEIDSEEVRKHATTVSRGIQSTSQSFRYPSMDFSRGILKYWSELSMVMLPCLVGKHGRLTPTYHSKQKVI